LAEGEGLAVGDDRGGVCEAEGMVGVDYGGRLGVHLYVEGVREGDGGGGLFRSGGG
jgi:hypothetical protein